MKIFYIVFIAVPIFANQDAAQTPEELLARIESHHKECSKISHVDSEALSKARNGNIDLSNEVLRKHIFCYVRKADLANDHDLQRPVIKAKVEAQLKNTIDVQKVMDGCDATVKREDDIPSYFAKMVDCFYKNLPKGTIIL